MAERGRTKFTPYAQGSLVWLEGVNLRTHYPTSKLAPKRYGPFPIKKVLSDVSYELVMITPYLSRDMTYCYRHCKGILHFPLLSVSCFASTHAGPDCFSFIDRSPTSRHSHRTHALKPHHMHCPTDSLVPCYLHPFPLDVITTYDSNPDSDLILSMTSLLFPLTSSRRMIQTQTRTLSFP